MLTNYKSVKEHCMYRIYTMVDSEVTDTIRYESLTCTEKLSVVNQETKTNKPHCPIISLVQDPRRQCKWHQKDYGGKNL